MKRKQWVLAIADLESFLLEEGIVSGEKTKMAAEMVGALDGFKYGDFGVEVYEYDVNSEEYIALSKGEEIPLKGMDGFTVGATAINGKFVLMGEPSQEAIDAFNSGGTVRRGASPPFASPAYRTAGLLFVLHHVPDHLKPPFLFRVHPLLHLGENQLRLLVRKSDAHL